MVVDLSLFADAVTWLDICKWILKEKLAPDAHDYWNTKVFPKVTEQLGIKFPDDKDAGVFSSTQVQELVLDKERWGAIPLGNPKPHLKNFIENGMCFGLSSIGLKSLRLLKASWLLVGLVGLGAVCALTYLFTAVKQMKEDEGKNKDIGRLLLPNLLLLCRFLSFLIEHFALYHKFSRAKHRSSGNLLKCIEL